MATRCAPPLATRSSGTLVSTVMSSPGGPATARAARLPCEGIARTALELAEKIGEDIARIAAACAAEIELEAARAAARKPPAPEIGKRARLAIGIDLAAIELPALHLVAEDLIGIVHLRESGRGLGVTPVVIG